MKDDIMHVPLSLPLLQKMDSHLKEIREESVELYSLPEASESMKKVLSQCLEGVKEGAASLTEQYQKLMKLCQQKRDLYIVAVKFHMTVRQVFIYLLLKIINLKF